MTDKFAHRAVYAKRYPYLAEVAVNLERFIQGLLEGTPRIDRIACRAKAANRFNDKAEKVGADGQLKYYDPINQIQDQIGARITTFYLCDVEDICTIVIKYFKAIEIQSKVPESSAAFGYFGEHFILKIPDDVIDNDRLTDAPEFFELQVKTLFQHAWSEADHDLSYKTARPLTNGEERKVAFTAAQAWGADKIFQELFEELSADNDDAVTMTSDSSTK